MIALEFMDLQIKKIERNPKTRLQLEKIEIFGPHDKYFRVC